MRVSALPRDAHVARAGKHLQVGVALHEAAEEEWAAVCYFYSAYHYVKAALLGDPIFDDPTACSRMNPDLNVEDRYTDRHHIRGAGGAGRGWGVNDLVLLLYPGIVGDYDRLHQASVSVRYREGLPSGALRNLRLSCERVTGAYSDGSLIAE